MRPWKHFFETAWTLSPLALWGYCCATVSKAALFCSRTHFEFSFYHHQKKWERKKGGRTEKKRGIVVVKPTVRNTQGWILLCTRNGTVFSAAFYWRLSSVIFFSGYPPEQNNRKYYWFPENQTSEEQCEILAEHFLNKIYVNSFNFHALISSNNRKKSFQTKKVWRLNLIR